MNEARPEISAIIICWDGMKFLPDLMRTLADDLSDFRHEIILVDNGSSDGSVEYIRKHYSGVNLIENARNLGFAPAVNIGLRAARGEYIYILNQDLRFRKGATAKLLHRLKQDPEIGLIGPGLEYFEGGLQHSVRSFPTYRHVFYRALFLDRLFPRHREFGSWRMGWHDLEKEAFVDQPMGAVMLIPRSVVEKVGYMDEAFPILYNDVDFCRRMMLAGYKRLYYPEARVEHYVGASTSRNPVRLHVISHLAFYRYLKKYARWWEYPVLWLCGLLLIVGLGPIALRTWQVNRA